VAVPTRLQILAPSRPLHTRFVVHIHRHSRKLRYYGRRYPAAAARCAPLTLQKCTSDVNHQTTNEYFYARQVLDQPSNRIESHLRLNGECDKSAGSVARRGSPDRRARGTVAWHNASLFLADFRHPSPRHNLAGKLKHRYLRWEGIPGCTNNRTIPLLSIEKDQADV